MKPNVVVIDDESAFSNAIIDKLMDVALIHSAENAEDGIRIAKELKPKVIVTDLIMPKKGGDDVIGEIRATDWGKDTKIIVLTALMDSESRKKCKEAGADDFLAKSEIKIKDLAEKIAGYLE